MASLSTNPVSAIMKTLLTVVASALTVSASLLASAPALANGASFTDFARVRQVTPEYERVNQPRQECTTEYISEGYRPPQSRSNTGIVIGGITGGVIGNQFGKGHGKEAATALGAVIGAVTGDRIDNANQRYAPSEGNDLRLVNRCRNVEQWQSRIVGYRVEYDYRGQTFSTFMRNDPGRDLRVRVSVQPD
jgi:uncharacterized protein YcfJ